MDFETAAKVVDEHPDWSYQNNEPYTVSFFGVVGEYMAVCQECNEGAS